METTSGFFDAFDWYTSTFFGAAPFWLALLGVVLWGLAGFTLGLHLQIRSSGYLTQGRVLGTVRKRRTVSSVGGDVEEDTARFLVLEYESAQGARKRGLSSEWEPAYARFEQDQPVTIRVISNALYDDLYVAGRQGAAKLALVLALAGFLCLIRYWQSPGLWLLGLISVVLVCVLTLRFLGRLAAPTELPADKQFDDSEIEPMTERQRN